MVDEKKNKMASADKYADFCNAVEDLKERFHGA